MRFAGAVLAHPVCPATDSSAPPATPSSRAGRPFGWRCRGLPFTTLLLSQSGSLASEGGLAWLTASLLQRRRRGLQRGTRARELLLT